MEAFKLTEHELLWVEGALHFCILYLIVPPVVLLLDAYTRCTAFIHAQNLFEPSFWVLFLKMKKEKNQKQTLIVTQSLNPVVYFCLHCFPVVSLHKQTQTE